jgi:hypothetical protein
MQYLWSFQLLAAAGLVSASVVTKTVRTLSFDEVVLIGSNGASSIIKNRDY